jgi:hypothetical protein
MIKASPEELQTEATPVIQAGLDESTVRQLIPVDFESLDPLAGPEPSMGALVRLETGLLAVVIYGLVTQTLLLKVAQNEVSADSVRKLLEEIRVPRGSIRWQHPDTAAAEMAEVSAVAR